MWGFYIKHIKWKAQILFANEHQKEYNVFDPMIKVIRYIKDMSGGTFLTYGYLRGVDHTI